MLHKSRRAAVLLATTAALSAGAVVAGTSAASSSRPHAAAVNTFLVIEHAITDTEYPSVTGKDAPGNELIFTNPIYNDANTQRIGHDEGFCTRLNPTEGSWECLWTTFLPGGQITVQGPYYDRRNSVLSITGGTGAYAGKRGQMVLTAREKGTQYGFGFQFS